MKKFKLTIRGNQYDVEILNVEDNIIQLEVNGTPYNVEVDKQLEKIKTPKLVRSVAVPSNESTTAAPRTSSPTAPKGTGAIKSPLPGTIIDIHVRVGDRVKVGQKLITLEAMKMENSIDADKDGEIAEIRVGKNDAVMEGDILMIIGE